MVDEILNSNDTEKMDLAEWGRLCDIREKGERLIEIENIRTEILRELYEYQLNHSADGALVTLMCYLSR